MKFLNLKTIIFNFHYFSFRDALTFPVYISKQTYFRTLKGKLRIESKLKPGIVRIGFDDVGIFDKKRSRTIWSVIAQLSFKGGASNGHGSKINVAKDGILAIGKNFKITAESAIVCTHSISFKDDCLISWDVLFMDSDFHKIKDENNAILNQPSPIRIAKNVWIGCRCLVLKGSEIPQGVVIAANSTVTKKLTFENAIYGGNPAKMIKSDINWHKK